MKQDIVNKIYKKGFNFEIDDKNLNKIVKAVVLDFPRGEVIVENDNFGTRRKRMDFTEGKKKANLHPLQIVFSGLEMEKACGGIFIGPDDQRHNFNEIKTKE